VACIELYATNTLKREEPASQRHKQLQVVTLDPMLLGSSLPRVPSGKPPLISCSAKAAASLSTLRGTDAFGMRGWRATTDQHKATCSTLAGSSPFRDGSGVMGLEVQA